MPVLPEDVVQSPFGRPSKHVQAVGIHLSQSLEDSEVQTALCLHSLKPHQRVVAWARYDDCQQSTRSQGRKGAPFTTSVILLKCRTLYGTDWHGETTSESLGDPGTE